MLEPTAETSRALAGVVKLYVTAEDALLQSTSETSDDAMTELVSVFVTAGDDVRRLMAQARKEMKADMVEDVLSQVRARNLAWLDRTHPASPSHLPEEGDQ